MIDLHITVAINYVIIIAIFLLSSFSFSDVSDDDFAKFGPHGSCFRLLNFDVWYLIP